MTAEEFAHGGTVRQWTLAGQKVVVVTYPDGSKLYVANTGPAYPPRFEATGSVGGWRVRRHVSHHCAAEPDAVG